MFDETSPLETVLLALMLNDEVRKASAPGSGDAIENLKARIPFIERSAAAARALATHIEQESSPAAIQKRAAAGRAERERYRREREAFESRITLQVKTDNAQAAVRKCAEGLAVAQRELASLRKAEAPDRDIVLAEGACGLWEARKEKAERALASLQKKAEAPRA